MAASGSGRPLQGTLLWLEERALATAHGAFRLHVFRDLEGQRPVLALLRGDLSGDAPLLARVHSSCATSESYGACDCDCAGQLDEALRQIAAAGRGVLFYLVQEGRGAGFAAKARDRMLVQASRQRLTTFEAYEHMGLGGDHRRYREVAFAARLLGLRAPLRLLTNNPDKVAALEAEKLAVAGTLPLRQRPSAFNLHYLVSKSRSGHALGDAPFALVELDGAEPPVPVPAFEPHALPGLPRFVRLASYQLPVALPGERQPRWLWLHLHHDLEEQRERVLLALEGAPGRAPLVCVQAEALVRRLCGDRAAWLGAAARMARVGAGCAAFLPAAVDAADAVPDAACVELLAHWAGARALAVDGQAAGAPALREALAARGVRLAAPGTGA